MLYTHASDYGTKKKNLQLHKEYRETVFLPNAKNMVSIKRGRIPDGSIIPFEADIPLSCRYKKILALLLLESSITDRKLITRLI